MSSERAPRPAAEQILWTGHPDWRGMIGWYVKAIIVAVVISAVNYGIYRSGVIGTALLVLVIIVAFAAVFLVGRLIRHSSTYTITTKRVSEQHGAFGRYIRLHKTEAPISRIDNTEVDASVVQRLLGVGTIDFNTAGERDRDELRWWGVRKPDEVIKKIEYVQYGDHGNAYIDHADPLFSKGGFPDPPADSDDED